MDSVEQNINIVSDLMKSCPGQRAEFSIFWAKGNKNWKQAGWSNKDRGALKGRLKEVLRIFQPDAIKVIINPKLSKERPQEHIIDVSGKFENIEPQQNHSQQQTVSGLNGTETGLGAVQLENLNKDFTIQLLNRDIDVLEEKVQKYKEKLKDAQEENDAIWLQSENLNKQGKNEKLLAMAALVIGKKLGIEMEPSMLAGLFGGPPMQIEANQNPELKETGISEANTGFSNQVNIIATFLSSIEEKNIEAFKNIIRILQKFESDPTLISTVLELIENPEN